jgi:hypothetical protein
VFFATVVALSLPATAQARGGGPNLLNSPGYQRALEDSRKQIQQSQPVTTPAARPRKKARHHAHG